MGLIKLIKTLDSFDVDNAAKQSIIDTDRNLAKIQQEQLFQGVKSNGKPILPSYKPRTIAYKKRKGQPTNRVTLKDTGDFYKGILIDVREDTYVITSADQKTGQLEQKYSPQIFGLNNDSKIEYIKILKKALIKRCPLFAAQ